MSMVSNLSGSCVRSRMTGNRHLETHIHITQRRSQIMVHTDTQMCVCVCAPLAGYAVVHRFLMLLRDRMRVHHLHACVNTKVW